jgi:hypothetical protein
MPLDPQEVEDLRSVFGELSTEELRRAVAVDHASYLPEALAIAQEELRRRPPPPPPPPAPAPIVVPPGPTGAATVATCAHHPERAATVACAHCGSYVCGLCLEPGTALCRPCSLRTRPLRHVPFSFWGAVANGSRLFFRCFGPLALLSAGTLSFVLAIGWASARFRLSNYYLWSIFYEASAGVIAITASLLLLAAASEGRKLGLWAALLRAVRLWPRMMGTAVTALLKILLYGLLLVVPGLIEATRLAVVLPVAALETGDAMARSHALVGRTRKTAWLVFGLVVASYLFAAVVTVFAQSTTAALMATAAPPGLGYQLSRIVTSWIAHATRYWFFAVLLAAYFGLDCAARAEQAQRAAG